ncbi:MAG: hypothetical protein KDJ29_18285 [Hyphomicrobiales bacterium]|nr:hypothetical protein [Hyphomicrobiales bacterium]
MSVVIVVSSPPDRKAYRSNDPRSAVVLAEKALWPLLESGRKVSVIVQATDVQLQQSLQRYFRDLVRVEQECSFPPRSQPEAPRNARA